MLLNTDYVYSILQQISCDSEFDSVSNPFFQGFWCESLTSLMWKTDAEILFASKYCSAKVFAVVKLATFRCSRAVGEQCSLLCFDSRHFPSLCGVFSIFVGCFRIVATCFPRIVTPSNLVSSVASGEKGRVFLSLR